MSHERRPTGHYYEKERKSLFSQGDIFSNVPLAYPSPADEIAINADSDQEGRRFLSGPLDIGWALLITPTCSMRTQGSYQGYAHPVRTLVPLRPVAELMDRGILDKSKLRLADKRDSLINYMYMPAYPDADLPESLALLYMPVTLHHRMIADGRVAQLSYEAGCQLQKKLVWHASSVLLTRDDFDPPMD